jgi:hypothetical protein
MTKLPRNRQWLDDALAKAVADGVRGFLDSEEFAETITKVALERVKQDGRPLTEVGFAYRIGAEFYDRGVPPLKAAEMGKRVLAESMADEKISFGDPRYAWDANGAVDLAHAYEIDHWDAA